MATQGIEGVGATSRTRQTNMPAWDIGQAEETGDIEDPGQAQQGKADVIKLVEMLILLILQQLLSQMRNPDAGGESSGKPGGAPSVGKAKAPAPGGNAPGGNEGSHASPAAPGGGSGSSGGKPAGAGDSKPAGSTSGGGNTTSNPLLNEINRVRREAGLSELTEKPELDDAASKNDAANNATGQLDHHNGLINDSRGEITAGATSAHETPETAVQQWLDSPEHRAIMMDPNYKYFGGSISGGFATADFS